MKKRLVSLAVAAAHFFRRHITMQTSNMERLSVNQQALTEILFR